jgi:hypothetical protein
LCLYNQEREGSTVPMLVKIKEFKSMNLWLWARAYTPPLFSST